MHQQMDDGFVYLPQYKIGIRPDGAVKTVRKGVHFGSHMRNGYMTVGTACGHRLVHRLVMEAFSGPPPSGADVNHKNGIRSDNRLANLEYCDRRYNNIDSAIRRGCVGCYKTRTGRWQAKMGRPPGNHLGTFDTKEEARDAYLSAQRMFQANINDLRRDYATPN